ncbi:transient receptor potential cation channel subfamily A member 1-like [Ptychodera flava]|uniref:transient receptor potential cation channel subfamily A member 1-like n=1 Tax=Ptychodera flava TaxID=63121 RepID=UPI00396A3559
MELTEQKGKRDMKGKFKKAGHLVAATAKMSRIGPSNGRMAQVRHRISRSQRISRSSDSRLGVINMGYNISEGEDSDEETTSFWQAVRLGKAPLVKGFLDDDWPVNKHNDEGWSALHCAAYYDRSDVTAILLQYGASVNSRIGQHQITPLHLAAKQDSGKTMEILVKNGAKIFAKDAKGAAPLHQAARHGSEQAAEILLTCEGADPNVKDDDGLTPLHLSALHGSVAVCNTLVKYKADVSAKEVNCITPLMNAAIGGHTEVMTLLIKTANKCNLPPNIYLEYADNEGNTALHLAVANGHLKATKLCLDYGADVDARKEDQFSALHVAAINNHTEIAVMLLARGAKVNAQDEEDMTPLHRAGVYNRTDMIKILLNRGADLEARDSEHFTPLLGTAWKGQSEAALSLLLNGANICATDHVLKTCLHWAVEENHVKYVSALLRHGAEILLNSKDSNDQTPLHYAAENGNLEMLQLLLSNGAKPDVKDAEEKVPLHIAAQYGQRDCAEALTEANPMQLNEDDIDGRTPLLLASVHGHHKVANALLKIGANISSRDDTRMSALSLAASKGHVDTVKVLIRNHADVHAVDKNKNTALHHSAASGHVAVTKKLLEKGADVTMENDAGKNALEVAIEKLHEGTAKVIMEHSSWHQALVVRDKDGTTPLKLLIEKLPDVALVALDQCVEYSHLDRTDPDLKVTYDYRYIDTNPDDVETKFRWNALATMVECRRESLLSHELSQSLLKKKWNRFVRYFFAVDFIFYFLFMIIMTLYAVFNPLILSADLDNSGCPVNDSRFYHPDGSSIKQSHLMFTCQIMIASYCMIQLLKEVLELFNQRLQYFMNFVNYADLGLYACSLIYVIPLSYKPCAVQWEAGAIAIFLAWIIFILYIRKFSVFGIYVVMFFSVLMSLMKAIILFILFAIAFGSAFYIMLARLEYFQNMPAAMLKVTVMTLGELDYSDMFYSTSLEPFDTTTYFIFIVFIFLMPIVLMNLLVGIAVGDIDKIQKSAYIERIVMDVDAIEKIETNLPKYFQRKLYFSTNTVEPNKKQKSRWTKIKKVLVKHQVNTEAIKAEESRDRNAEKLDALEKEVDRIASLQRTMATLLEQQVDYVKMIGEKLDVTPEVINLSTPRMAKLSE